MTSTTAPYLHLPGASELRWLGETFTYFLATGEATGEMFALVDEQAQRGEAVPLHRHAQDAESFYVLEGVVTFFLADQPGVDAPAGSFVHVPAGTVHGFRVASDTARYLILTTPQHGRFYEAITLPSRPGGLPPEGSVDGAQIERACAKYGVEFVGPLPDAARA